MIFNTNNHFFKKIKMTYINVGSSNYSRYIFSKRDQTFQYISWDVIHKNKVHTAKQLITLSSRGVKPKPPGEGGSSKWIHLNSWLVEKKKMLYQKEYQNFFWNCISIFSLQLDLLCVYFRWCVGFVQAGGYNSHQYLTRKKKKKAET